MRQQASQRADRSGGGTEEDGEAEAGTEDMDTQDNAVSDGGGRFEMQQSSATAGHASNQSALEHATDHSAWPRRDTLACLRSERRVPAGRRAPLPCPVPDNATTCARAGSPYALTGG